MTALMPPPGGFDLRIAVTGAGGFIGGALVSHLLAGDGHSGLHRVSELVAVDARLPAFGDERVVAAEGDLLESGFRDAVFDRPFDVVFHLAAVPGGAAARDPVLGWAVNVDAGIAILAALARQKQAARLVLASSVAVFGVPLPRDRVDDDTLPLPSMSYGAHKLICETALADFARRGLVDGIAPRLPGIIARPPVKGGHISAYMSDVLHAIAAGEAYECPVAPQATAWFMSRSRCVENLAAAAALPRGMAMPRRAFNLPALHLSMAELIAGAGTHFGADATRRVSFAPNPEIEAQFGSYPPLLTPVADALGLRHDGDATALVARALELSDVTTQGSAA